MVPRNLTQNFVLMFEGARGPAGCIRWTPRLYQTARGGYSGNSRSSASLYKIRLLVEGRRPHR